MMKALIILHLLAIISLSCCFVRQSVLFRKKTCQNSCSFQLSGDLRTKEHSYNLALSVNGTSVPCIILVSPELDMNVGSVARAMLNFGLHELRVVDPKCNIVSGAARALSSGADKILENAQVYSDLSSCVSDLQSVLATTVRPRDMNYRIITPSRAAEIVYNTSPLTCSAKTGIMFGRESDGLTNDELSLAHTVISIPTFKHFSSLNLAQAVNIICYELWKQRTQLENNAQPVEYYCMKDFDRLATQDNLRIFFSRIDSFLDFLKYGHWDSKAKERFIFTLQTVFRKAQLTEGELTRLHGPLSLVDKLVSKRQNKSWWSKPLAFFQST